MFFICRRNPLYTGILSTDEYGIVYATIPSNVDYKVDSIGLIAHMDTSPDCSGANIKPRIINKYDGSDIVLNENTIMKVSDFPSLKDNINEDLIVTDGTTLLGADDKAGIAIIVETAYRIIKDKSFKHGDIKIAFTPDEEVGRGTENFDVKFFNADYAYTLDGGDIKYIEYENFNAASVIVTIKGINIHPGSAKDKMVNSILLANEFDSLLPQNEIPSKTCMYEGFHHLCDIHGDVENTTLVYIVRNHDYETLLRQLTMDMVKKVSFIYLNDNEYFVGAIDIRLSIGNVPSISETTFTLNKISF